MKKLGVLIGGAALTYAAGTSAEVNFRGFGSIVAGKAFGLDEGQEVLGYDDTWTFRDDSLVALQADADLEDGLSVTVQFISHGENDFQVETKWAYVTYEISDTLQVSAGRMQAPFYRYTDFLDVHYAYNWLEGPERVYGLRFPSYDGISFVHSTSLGPVDSTLQIIGGKLDTVSVIGDLPTRYEGLLGIAWQASWEWFTGRVSYLQADVSIEQVPGLDGISAAYSGIASGLAGLSQTFQAQSDAAAAAAPQFSALLGEYAQTYADAADGFSETATEVFFDTDPGYFAGIGLAVDWNALVIDSEFVQYGVDDAFYATKQAFYITAGWRINSSLIYLTYSRQEADDEANFDTPDLASISADLISDQATFATFMGDALQQGALTANQGAIGGDTAIRAALDEELVNIGIGIRYDFHASAAFKAEYEQEDNKISDADGSIFRLAIDFVF